MIVYLLNMLSKFCKVYILLGNHDINANNINRVDALSPIIFAVNNPNVYISTTT